ncbi:MAG: hypothetical protein WDO73_37020, partial [Ignavibacteriota bacterium]
VTALSKVHDDLLSERLDDLYSRRDKVVQAIQALEELENLRSRRSEPGVLAMLVVNRYLDRPATIGRSWRPSSGLRRGAMRHFDDHWGGKRSMIAICRGA